MNRLADNSGLFVFVLVAVTILGFDVHAGINLGEKRYGVNIYAWDEQKIPASIDSIAIGRFRIGCPADAIIGSIRDTVTGKTLLDSMVIRVETQRGLSGQALNRSKGLHYVDVREKYFSRRTTKPVWTRDDGRVVLESELYSEIVPVSQCISVFCRFIGGKETEPVEITGRFHVNRRCSTVFLFGPEGHSVLNVETSHKRFSAQNHFVVFYDSSKASGLVVAMHPTEVIVRKWDTTFYNILDTVESNGGVSQRDNQYAAFTINGLSLESAMTADARFYLMPFTGSVDSAVRGFVGIYFHHRGLGYYFSQSYFPVEGYSNQFLKAEDGFVGMPHGAFTWGWLTQEFPIVEGLRKENRLNGNNVLEDELIRHYINYCSKSGTLGLVPYRLFPEHWLRDDQNIYQRNFVFARSAISILRFGREYFGRYGKETIAREYCRWRKLETLFRADTSSSWTIRQNDSSYWFLYTWYWKQMQRTDRLVNAHSTALVLAMEMEAFSEEAGLTEELEFWSDVVKRGIDGLAEYLKCKQAWVNGHIGGVLVYKEGGSPIKNYDTILRETIVYGYSASNKSYRKKEIFTLLKIPLSITQ